MRVSSSATLSFCATFMSFQAPHTRRDAQNAVRTWGNNRLATALFRPQRRCRPHGRFPSALRLLQRTAGRRGGLRRRVAASSLARPPADGLLGRRYGEIEGSPADRCVPPPKSLELIAAETD